MPSVTNATAEIAAADQYSNIRLFTVGAGTQGQPGQPALYDLQTVEQPWVVANSSTVGSGGEFGVFSAVCWFFGRRISDHLGNAVPIGAKTVHIYKFTRGVGTALPGRFTINPVDAHHIIVIICVH